MSTVGLILVHLFVPIAGIGAVLGGVILWDRLREPYRRLERPFEVADRRTYRDAARRVDRLIARGDWQRAHYGAIAITTWLHSERHYGSQRRQRWVATELERWRARRQEMDPTVLL